MAKAAAGKTVTVDMKSMLTEFQSDMGESIGSYGGTLIDGQRVPTGIFPFDLATGGGFPRGKCSIVYGPESSGKTNMALLAIANHQKLWPHLTCVFFDIENSFDPKWAKALGVDTDRLIVIKPSYAEQMVDMCERFLYAEDCGIVVVDSLAALVTTQEADSSAEKANVGGTGLVTGKLVRKTTLALGEAEKAGRQPTLIYINQTRFKIGVMFGDPETMPGGNAPRFQANLWIRVYGKNVMDPKMSQVMPVLKETKFVLKKWKCPIVAASGEFKMVTYPHNGLKVGETDDWNTISQYLKDYDQLKKKEGSKGGWIMLDEEYPTVAACKQRLYTDKPFGMEVRQALIQRVMSEGMMEEGEVA